MARRATDRPEDLPEERVGYAMRDLDRLRATASGHGENIGIYTRRLLDDPLPWTGCAPSTGCSAWSATTGPAHDAACGTALDPDVVSVSKIASMLAKALENTTPELPAAPGPPAGRFARDPSELRSRTTILTLVHSQPREDHTP